MSIPGFTRSRVATNGIHLSVHRGGQGAPVILLHGFPQNHHCWEEIAPVLAENYDVIVPDLRGYGDSDAPQNDPENRAYSKREMAQDIACLMDALEIERAMIVGHDRGARVSYRFALDHPEKVSRLAILEVVPTGDFWASWNADLALAAYHWTFLAQPAPLPEQMILGVGAAYVERCLAQWTHGKTLSVFSDAALASYRAQGTDPVRVAAMCDDYRAGATFDRALDEADQAERRQLTCPFLFLWAEEGFPARTGDPLGLWRGWAPEVQGQAIPGTGHFMPEEVPEAVLAALRPFLAAAA